MLRQRIITAVIALAVLAIVLFFVPGIIARLFIAALVLAGAYEWGGFIFKFDIGRRWLYVVFIGALIGMVAIEISNLPLVESVLKISLAWWLCALLWLFFFPTGIPGVVSWLCGGLVLVPAWLALDRLYVEAPEILLFALLTVWIADIGAYFIGKGFGRVKLAPAISPGKTWEGVLGGVSAVVLLAAVGSRFLAIDIKILVPFCIAVTMLSIVGDLTVSMFKRSAGVKDSGSLFPGHGGVMDRIDSVTAAAPLFALALHWLGSTQ